MIVIATNNSCVERVCRGSGIVINNFLERILNSIERIDYIGDVLVVDTGSDDLKSILYLDELKNSNFKFNLIIDKSPNKNYSTGAYIYAFYNYVSDYYIFLQDSVEIKDINFIETVENMIIEDNVICWVKGIGLGLDNEEQGNFV